MCGRCRQVFNAFQSLSRLEEPAGVHATDLPEAMAERTDNDDTPVTFPATDITNIPVVDPLFLREEPSPLPAAFAESQPVPRVLPQSIAMPGTAREDWPSYRHAREVTLSEPAIDFAGDSNPLLAEVSTSRGTPAAANVRGWRVGVFVMFVGLLAQATYAFRTTLVSNYPQLRPGFTQLCELAGCSLSWGRDETVLKLDASELIETPGKPGHILLTAILVNRGKTKQDLPSLELRLTDNANQIVVSRLLHPRDYLGRAIDKDEGLTPNTELYVNMDLNLERGDRPPASGYGLIVFYP